MRLAAALVLAAAMPFAGADELSLAWLRDGHVQSPSAQSAPLPVSVPLGSLWKLFVYAYAVQTGLPTPAYRCLAVPRAGEEYCCAPGGTVERNAALARSCALFFEPARLHIQTQPWRAFWQPLTADRARWVADLDELRPDTRLGVDQILSALAVVPAHARTEAQSALLPVMTDGYGRGALPHLGGLLRVKTFTWAHPDRPGSSIGGGAGWMVDGTPVWFAAPGASRTVLAEQAQRLAQWLPEARGGPDGDACVLVDYFARYSVRKVERFPGGEPAADGPLSGQYRVTFENGNAVLISSGGELSMEVRGQTPVIWGRLALSDYVARVVDREADARLTHAARALAIVARTWLTQNAPFEAGCFRVADSSRTQRVSPRAASRPARDVSLFTDGLVLDTRAVYRLDQPTPGVLAWTEAAAQSRAGQTYDAILAAAFPGASLAPASGERQCRRLPEAEAWLTRMLPRWRRQLSREPGFEALEQPPTVCALDYGNPYADAQRLRIHVRELRTREDRISLAHEFLHLTFRYHPRGSDEAFIEQLARALTDG
ncbi:MAG TPA: DUF2300 domain-containing protein [Burkholderiales bacterium]|nr:DUF2300 domain-containing protein [Burkholderiales bacterium]